MAILASKLEAQKEGTKVSRVVINQNGKKLKRIDTIYIGYDDREHLATNVLIDSIERLASRPINVVTLNLKSLRLSGLYRRTPHVNSTVWGKDPVNNMVDAFDERPFSTDFSFSRFLIPFLNQHEGLALFMDCDMFFRDDPCILFDEFYDQNKAVSCVKSKHEDKVDLGLKMYGCPQTKYSRKNWSSFVLWNCGHESHKNLTVDDVNTKPGRWLHNFLWLSDEEIGDLPARWNWLDGYSDENVDPANVHFTTGGPWFDRWKAKRPIDQKYADEWKVLSAKVLTKIQSI